MEPNRELRMFLVDLLRAYPDSMVNPMVAYRKSIVEVYTMALLNNPTQEYARVL